MGLLRAFGLLFVVLVVLYAVLRVALTLRERARLRREWEMSGTGTPREDFVRAGMERHARSLGRRLLWGVIVVPMAALAILLYLLNVS